MSDQGGTKSGLEMLINQGQLVAERLPMLEVVLDRLMRLLTTSLRNFTLENIDISVKPPKPIRFGDYMDGLTPGTLFAVFQAEEWEDVGLLAINSDLTFSIVEILLGGRRSVLADMPTGRPFTPIERRLVEKLSMQVLQDLSVSFEPVSPVHFHFERLEANSRFMMIAKPADACIVFELAVAMDNRGGIIHVVFPLATLEPVRESLLQMFMGEKFGRDSIWEGHLARELWDTEVELEAILSQTEMNLAETLKWQVGTCIEIDQEVNPLVNVVCGEILMFKSRIGQKNGFVALQIEDIITMKEPEDD
jgi:flagellar motor switch protein FliM